MEESRDNRDRKYDYAYDDRIVPTSIRVEDSRGKQGGKDDYAYDDFVSIRPYRTRMDVPSTHSYIEVIRDDQPVEGTMPYIVDTIDSQTLRSQEPLQATFNDVVKRIISPWLLTDLEQFIYSVEINVVIRSCFTIVRVFVKIISIPD